MWKISHDTLIECVNNVIKSSKEEPSTVLEMVEMQVTLKNFDPQKKKRLQAKKAKALGEINNTHHDDLKRLSVPSVDARIRKMQKKNARLIRMLTRKYQALLSSDLFLKDMPPTLNFGLNAGDILSSKSAGTSAGGSQQGEESKYRNRKNLNLTIPIGHVDMDPDELAQNLKSFINILIPLLKKQWLNVRNLHIKSTMGVPHKLY